MIIFNNGQLHGIRLNPHTLSVAAEEKYALGKFSSGDTSMSYLRRIIVPGLPSGDHIRVIILGPCSLLDSRSPIDSSNPTDRSSDHAAEFPPMRVLIIEDDAAVREAIGYILEDLEVEFDAVGSGEEGLTKLDEQTYSLVFLDLVLHTGSHGIEIYNRICEREKHPNVVLMTASGSREHIFVEAAKLGQYILRKPFSLGDVERIVNEAKKQFSQS